MKWVMFLLLLANAAYFSWQYYMPSPPKVAISHSPVQGKGLILAHELESTVSEKPTHVLEKAPVSVVAKPTPQPAPQPQPVTAARSTPSKPVVRPDVATEKPKSVDVVPAKPRPLIKSEAKPAAPAREQPVAKALALQAQGAGIRPRACYAIGPFLLTSDVSSAASIFKQANIPASQRSKAQRKQVGYWVYVPAFATGKEAARALKEIRNAGISGVQPITEGSKANALSAGVYQGMAQAEQRQAKISTLGYAVRLEPLYRTQPQYWLDVALQDSTKLPSRLWAELSSSRPNIRQERRKCD